MYTLKNDGISPLTVTVFKDSPKINYVQMGPNSQHANTAWIGFTKLFHVPLVKDHAGRLNDIYDKTHRNKL